MNINKIPEFKSLFDEFKQTEEYELRSIQTAFAKVAKKIIAATLKNDPFKNEYLTGFIQIFKWGTTDENFDKYLAINVKDKEELAALSDEAYDTREFGYTAAGKTAINSLSPKQLGQVKAFLLDAFNISTIDEAKKLTDKFDDLDIPEVKSGIYSPWLHYINPVIFPIINNSHKSFLDWMKISKRYSDCIDAFHTLKEITSEAHLAMLDSYTHTFQEDSTETQIKKLEEKLRQKFPRIWRCADSLKWDDIKKTDLLTFDWLDKTTDYKKINFDDLERGQRAIKPWVNELKKGDLIFIMGKNTYNGICISESEYDFNGPFLNFSGSGEKPAIKIKYLSTVLNPVTHTLTTHNNPTTFAPIDGYNFGLFNVLKYLYKKQPEAYSTLQKIVFESEKTITMSTQTKNIILFGPPGTGKTYNSIDKAVEIVTGNKSNHASNKVTFDSLRAAGQIEFITFHQNYSYEDFIVGLKPDAEFEQLRFKPFKGIFYEMAKRARENYFASKESRSIEKDFDTAFNEIVQPLAEGKEVEIKMKSGISFWIYDLTTASILFRKSNGSTIHTLSIDSLKDLVDGARKTPVGLEPYYNPLVALIKEKKIQSKDVRIEMRKNFVLIIDEINRANISRVFGELITLLEDDKRIGEPNELRITLPNGEKDFGVPPNLFLIGTMNTADKSIALVDIALRRRFEFIGYYPDYELPELEASKVALLQHINKIIYNKKKSADFLIGHAYFLNNSSIEGVIRNKVIPLLMEYFSGKSDIISEIFSGSNWKVSYDEEKYSWDIQNILNS